MLIQLLAMHDMRGNLILASTFLIIGVVILRFLNSQTGTRVPRRSLVITTFLCGPAVAIVFFVADVFWLAPYSYVLESDYIESSGKILLIGLFVGGIGSAVLWFTELMFCFRARARDSCNVPHADETDPPRYNDSMP